MSYRGKQKHLATYRVYYEGQPPYSLDCWETAFETDIEETLEYLTGELMYELLDCEPCAKKLEIVVHARLSRMPDDFKFWHNMELPVFIRVRIEHIERPLQTMVVGEV